jgi:hypothetical protein
LSVDGANRIAEMLHVNSALTSLDLACELFFTFQQISVCSQLSHFASASRDCDRMCPANAIEDEGAMAIAGAIMQNTTLVS